jgi:hypothetical protein
MSQSEPRLREKPQLSAVDNDHLSVLAERIAALENANRSPQLAEVENYGRILKALQSMVGSVAAQLVEASQWLQWYARAGAEMRKLFEDVAPLEPDGMPTDIGAAIATATATAAPVAPASSSGLPPELAALLGQVGMSHLIPK